MVGRRTGSARLDSLIEVGVKYQRSLRAESPAATAGLLGGYVLTDRARDLLGRVLESVAAGPRLRAWSVTGPYGSGKSSFLAFLGALLGDSASPAFLSAMARLEDSSSLLASALSEARAGVGSRGFIVAITTANRESVTEAIARALLTGAEDYWSGRGRKPAVLHEVRQRLSSGRATALDLLDCVKALEQHAPVLLCLDEFGKVLEFAAEKPAVGDLYVLQLLAEHCNTDTVPSCILTSQHLSVADYSQALPVAAQREWLKVQGRFEDVAFASSFDQSVALIRGHLKRGAVNAGFDAAVAAWADKTRRQADLTGSTSLRSLCSSIEAYYPLHPLALALAPSLSQRYNQGDRSIHSWLASREPASVAGFLASHEFSPGTVLPVYGLSELFEYFLGQPSIAQRSVRPEARWLEVLERVQDSSGRGELQEWLVRVIALFNLAEGSTDLRCSRELLEFAACAQGNGTAEDVRGALLSLKADGFIVFRDFANEYRVWQGSDVDVEAEICLARQKFAELDVVSELNRVAPAAARVAQRHGHNTGTFRYFKPTYAVGANTACSLDPGSDVDGALLLAFDDSHDAQPLVSRLADGRPVVACLSPDTDLVTTALREVLALDAAYATAEVVADAVARREIRARQALASAELLRRVRTAFDPHRRDLRWHAMGQEVRVNGPRGLSALLSDVCDATFSKCVPLRNEVLNRVQLSSQGAKARRILLDRMISAPGQAAFGIEGFGPERAMYESLLAAMNFHGPSADGVWELREPDLRSPARPAWDAIEAFVGGSDDRQRSLSEVFETLTLPPFGLREPVVPMLLVTFLCIHRDDVALYQDGTFEPELTSPLIERLLKAPDRFTVRKVLNGGSRALVLRELTKSLRPSGRVVEMRNAGILVALRPVMSAVRSLNEQALHTKRVSTEAQRVRAAVLEARQLDELLFADLPRAVGVSPIAINGEADGQIAREFASRLASALSELTGAHAALLNDLALLVRDTFGVPEGTSVRDSLRERSRRMQGHLVDPKLRSFVLYASDDHLDDQSWIETIALNLSDKPPSSWRDSDGDVFETRLRELGGLFARVEYLCCAVAAADAAEGFVARRIAVTQPDGRELSRVVWADEREVEDLRQQARALIEESGGLRNNRRLNALLAVLADEILLEPTTSKRTSEARGGGPVDSDKRVG